MKNSGETTGKVNEGSAKASQFVKNCEKRPKNKGI